jgi:hypothetical protein
MKLDEAIKVSDVQWKLDDIREVTRIKAVRFTRRKQKLIAFTERWFAVVTYSGPSDRRREESLVRVYRRSTLFYAEVKGKTDWEPV